MLTTGAARGDELAQVQRLHAIGQTGEALQRAEKHVAANPKDAGMRFLAVRGDDVAAAAPKRPRCSNG